MSTTRNVAVGTPSPASNPPTGSINVAGNIYQNGVLFSGGGSTAETYMFEGLYQSGTPGWKLNWTALTNITLSSTGTTYPYPTLVVAAAATGSPLWSITRVASTVTSVTFAALVSSTDQTNAGSIALSYACVPVGTAMGDPTPTALTALSLPTIAATSAIYNSTQTVSCTGTETSPSSLYVWWTPTAPSGGTLSLLRLALTY